MFRAPSAHLQEDTDVYMQPMVLSLSMRPPGTLIESENTIGCIYTSVSSWRWALEARNM